MERRFHRLLANALPYTGQTDVSELDAIISCNREIQKAKAEADDGKAAMHQTGRTILNIMAYFEIAAGTILTCEIPGEFELQVWADEDHTIQCRKTKDLNPLKGDPNVIVIKLVADPYNFDEGDN